MKQYMLLLLIPLILVEAAGCRHDHEQTALAVLEEHESITVTRWTDTAELFIEYEEVTAGHPSEFITHVTLLEDFSPLSEGTMTFTFTDEDNETVLEVTEG